VQKLRIRGRKRAGIAIFLLVFLTSGLAIYSQCHFDSSDFTTAISHQSYESSPIGNLEGTVSNSTLLDSCFGASFIILFFAGKYFRKRKKSNVGWSQVKIPIKFKIRLPQTKIIFNNPLQQLGVLRI